MPDNQEYISLKVAFEPFAKFEQGAPIRILPEGTWFRGSKKLEVTKGRLVEMAKNFVSGLPRFRIPINLDHEKNGGKVGTITDIQYLPNGPSGPGLYATDYEFTEKGLEAIEENGYDAVSAEVVWTVGGKIGGMYQDPETGKDFDNVLVGMALTPTPFFGHGHVALFHAHAEDVKQEAPYGGAKSFEEYELQKGEEDERSRISNLHYIFQTLFDNIWNDPFMPIDAKIEAVDIITREFREKVTSGDEYSEDKSAQEEIMSDKEKTAEELAAEAAQKLADKFDGVQLSKEDFSALQAKAELADTQAAELVRLEEEKKAQKTKQRAVELRAVADKFNVLPVEVDEFVVQMTALESANADSAAWVQTQFEAFDKALEEAGVLKVIGTDEEGGDDDFLSVVEQILTDEFDGDRNRYDEALLKASADHPELAKFA